MAGDVVAAGLDGLPAADLRRADAARGAALHHLAGRMARADAGSMAAIVVARRLEPGGLHHRLQLGVAVDRRIARGAVPRSFAGLGAAGGDGRGRAVLAGVAVREIEFAGGFSGSCLEHLVGGFQQAGPLPWRRLERRGSGGAHDVDGGRLAVAGGID